MQSFSILFSPTAVLLVALSFFLVWPFFTVWWWRSTRSSKLGGATGWRGNTAWGGSTGGSAGNSVTASSGKLAGDCEVVFRIALSAFSLALHLFLDSFHFLRSSFASFLAASWYWKFPLFPQPSFHNTCLKNLIHYITKKTNKQICTLFPNDYNSLQTYLQGVLMW